MGPAHEPVQTAELANPLMAGTKVQVVSVGQQDLRSDLFELLLRYALHRAGGADGHEGRRLDGPVGRLQSPDPRPSGRVARQNLKSKWSAHLPSRLTQHREAHLGQDPERSQTEEAKKDRKVLGLRADGFREPDAEQSHHPQGEHVKRAGERHQGFGCVRWIKKESQVRGQWVLKIGVFRVSEKDDGNRHQRAEDSYQIRVAGDGERRFEADLASEDTVPNPQAGGVNDQNTDGHEDKGRMGHDRAYARTLLDRLLHLLRTHARGAATVFDLLADDA